jgi:hypothetical protein
MSILRELFGPSKEEVWAQLAEQIGGHFTSGFFSTRLVAKTGQWTVTLDTQTTNKSTYTRMRAPYVNADNFRFDIHPAGFWTPMGEMLGLRDLTIGNPRFDEHFVIQGNDARKVCRFFSDPVLKALIYSQWDMPFRFRVKDDDGWFSGPFPQGVDELSFERQGVMKDLKELRSLFELFSYTLHRLCHLGSAYEDDPDRKL